MCFIKDLFWDGEDVVVQYHPAKSEYVNIANFCLHLWRPIGKEIITPSKYFVGGDPTDPKTQADIVEMMKNL